MQKTLGGQRLGSGNKQKVYLHGYERSTHNLSAIWRSTMSAGTLVPFLKLVALPGDTFDIELDLHGNTHPTIGPLFGSYKVQLDIFSAPIRLYQGQLHNNKLKIGMNMADVKLPIMTLTAIPGGANIQNSQINPSCILAYLGTRGIGNLNSLDVLKDRSFNAVPLLMYWETVKQYYSNKQEEIGAVIHTPTPATPILTIDNIEVETNGATPEILALAPAMDNLLLNQTSKIFVNYTGTSPLPAPPTVTTTGGQKYLLSDLFYDVTDDLAGQITYQNFKWAQFGNIYLQNWEYTTNQFINQVPQISTFDLSNIDDMREFLLSQTQTTSPIEINDFDLPPYSFIALNGANAENVSIKQSQEGLALKTYQSDLFNNWLSTDWIDGVGGISEVTAIDTSGGSFTIDTLNLSKKVYDMLNRIAVSGGTYDDWLETVYDHEPYTRCESPIYHGGLIRELVFQEVVSNSDTETPNGQQPLGTLAGKGIMSNKSKGGKVIIKVDEPSYIMGIVSLTPRIDYSQGNDWDIHLQTMDDFHKPALDEIGFQELITEQMAWWSTSQDSPAGPWVTRSAGKQPAWINYMTNINKTYGNFAIEDNEMFMTLNRRYERDSVDGARILDLTTYIDPSKFNFIFAQTAIDSQNFWIQIASDITARRKMSAKVMPNV